VDEKYRPLCEMLLHNVYLLQSGEEEELSSSLPSEHLIILSGSGKFSKSKVGMSGGSVGLFEGKRIGRAKNMENLAKELKQLEAEINTFKTSIEQGIEKQAILKASSQKQILLQIEQDSTG
jgi:chromosome segregation protein